MNRTRQKQIVIRMSDDEQAAIKKKIERSGINQQQFLIRAAMEKPIINTDGIKAVVPELKRIGTNLNQIAKKCNEGRYIDDETSLTVQTIGKELNEIWLLLRQLTRGRASDEP